MKVTLLASAAFALPTLDALLEAGFEVAVGTQPARPAGRGRSDLRPTEVAQRCLALGLPARELDDVNDPGGLAWLTASQPDVVAVVAFGQKLSAPVRAVAPWGCINLHPSLLPRWRGAAPVPAAVMAGDDTTGVCVIDVAERMDAGDILLSRITPVGRKTAGDLLEELAATGAALMVEAIHALVRDDLRRRRQDESKATRAPKLVGDDGRLRWEHDALSVDRRVRAVTPRPGAFALLGDGQRLRVLSGEPVSHGRGPLPGEIVRSDGQGVVVACGSNAYRITRLQREGGKPMGSAEFLRGFELPAGARLGP